MLDALHETGGPQPRAAQGPFAWLLPWGRSRGTAPVGAVSARAPAEAVREVTPNTEGSPMSARSRIICAALAASLALAPVSGASACTGIMLKAKDGSLVHGRTAEFGVPLDLGMAFVPKGTPFVGHTPAGEGMAFTAKYAALGATAFGAPSMLDGINEAGLSAGAFYFPTFAGYTEITPENRKRALAPTEFLNYVLTQFATIDEVKKAVMGGEVVIAPTVVAEWGPAPAPFHFVVYDRTGAIVIEPLGGKLVVTDNPLGVITNSPAFDWHMTNLRNYVSLRPLNVPPVTVDRLKLQPLGQGSGMVGLPGDFTPPSRFVRAAVFSATAVPPASVAEGVTQVFHVLNNFDIPVGVAADKDGDKVGYDFTLATVARDPLALRYYWKTYEDQTIRVLDLKALIAQGGPAKVRHYVLPKTQSIPDMTADVPR